MAADAPIGIFDSGVGGLSILREIQRELPAESLIYVADSAFAPYGNKPADVISARAGLIVRWFQQRQAKLVVAACNTATGVAVDGLRAAVSTPIVGIEPAVKPAAMHTKSGVIGVLATEQTLASDRFERLVSTHGRDVQVVEQPCPGLAEQVEKGELTGAATTALIDRYVRPLLERGADTIVLGCTHYTFLTPAIQAIAGPGVTLIDPATAVAREVGRRLSALNLAADGTHTRTREFWTTGSPATVQAVLARLGQDVEVRPLTINANEAGAT